jgi:hypothetical protein
MGATVSTEAAETNAAALASIDREIRRLVRTMIAPPFSPHELL